MGKKAHSKLRVYINVLGVAAKKKAAYTTECADGFLSGQRGIAATQGTDGHARYRR